MEIEIRPIREEDNTKLAAVIRKTLTEFKADKPGTVFYDESTDHLSQVFKTPGSFYFVALLNGELVGGAGIFPTAGLPAKTAELVKMYLLPQARGKGFGKALIEKALEKAKATSYNRIYLETMPELKQAVKVYEKMGFRKRDAPLGNSGHFSCDIWMEKEI